LWPGKQAFPTIRAPLIFDDRISHQYERSLRMRIELLPEGKRRAKLEERLARDLEAWFSGRVLPVDRLVAARWASPLAQAARTGRPLPAIDSLIAATALACGAATVNPWEAV
jgi:predicted nucleic acid-binding protein